MPFCVSHALTLTFKCSLIWHLVAFNQDAPPCCAVLKSDKTIQVSYIQNPPCLGSTSNNSYVVREMYGGSSVSLLVPNQLFHMMYIWRWGLALWHPLQSSARTDIGVICILLFLAKLRFLWGVSVNRPLMFRNCNYTP